MKRSVAILFALSIWASAAVAGPFEDGVAAYERKDYATAFALLKPFADQGDASAQAGVGVMYANGWGVPKNEQQAAVWFRKAADQGFARAQFALGVMYSFGQGVPKDEQQAAVWYRKAADQGFANAQYNLGVAYEKGLGVPKDEQQAVIWYRWAADQGEASAQLNLGVMYVNGRGVPKDEQQAVVWFRKAADQGEARAQYGLGLMYAFGRGVPKDEQQALVWYGKAAAQGLQLAAAAIAALTKELEVQALRAEEVRRAEAREVAAAAVEADRKAAEARAEAERKAAEARAEAAHAEAERKTAEAQYNLGVMYANGRGVPKDDRQAVLWYRKAADQGFASAQYNLGVMYANGRGVPKDEQQAYFWWLLASASGHSDATRNRDIQEKTLPAPLRIAAQAAARDWKPGSSAATSSPSSPSRSSRADTTGSAFRVGVGHLVTNRHVIEDCAHIRVDGQLAGQVAAQDERNDLALIKSAGSTGLVASIRTGRPLLGEAVTVAGFPLQGLLTGLSTTNGNVSRMSGLGGDTRLIQISAPVQPGNSGGPLIDARGAVIGVVVSKLDALKVAKVTGDIPQNVNFALNSNVLRSFLDANNVDYRDATAGPALSPTALASRAQAFTVLVECWK